MYFKCKGEKFYLKNGTNQGSPLSPALFDIYMEDVMRQVKERANLPELWYKLYADDLVVMVESGDLEKLIVTLKEVSTEYSLIVNPKKSAIVVVKNHGGLEDAQTVQDIPIVDSYRYLGIEIDGRGEVSRHILTLK